MIFDEKVETIQSIDNFSLCVCVFSDVIRCMLRDIISRVISNVARVSNQIIRGSKFINPLSYNIKLRSWLELRFRFERKCKLQLCGEYECEFSILILQTDD